MKNLNKIDNLLKKLPLLRKIDLSLSRINRLNKDLNTNLKKIQNKTVTFTGTNGKFSCASAMRSIFEAAGYKCDVFSSPHISQYTERYVFESKEINEQELFKLFLEVAKVNGSKPITIFEFLTAAFYYYCDKNSNSPIILAENGLFNFADAVTSIGKHLQKIITFCGLDHLDWLPAGKKTIDQVIIEKTKNINCSSIIVSKQSDNQILNKIKENLKTNPAKQIIFSQNYSFEINKDGFLYKDNYGAIQLPKPKLLGEEHQIANFCCAIAAVRNLKKYKITNEHIIEGITSIKTIKGRLSILDKGRLKQLAPSNTIIYDIASNPGAAKVTSKYLNTLDKNKKIYCIAGMLNNKIHDGFFHELSQTNISEILTIDISNNENCIKKEKLKEIVEKIGIKTQTKNSIQDAIKYIANKDPESTILIIGSIYLIGEVLNLN